MDITSIKSISCVTSLAFLAAVVAGVPSRAGEVIWVDEGSNCQQPCFRPCYEPYRPACEVPIGRPSCEIAAPCKNDHWIRESVKESHLGFSEDDGPGTLFQWSYGHSEGGPNLDEPLVTDRPDFTEASSTVGRRIAQIEFGYTFTADDEDPASLRSHSIGEPILRYGIGANWLEFRIGLFPISEEVGNGPVNNSHGGTEDLYLGFKIGLTPQFCHWPEMALIPQMTVPTGSSDLTNDEVLPGVNWVYSWELNDEIAIGGSTQVNRAIDEESHEPYLEIAQSVTVGLGLSDTSGVYTEWYALFPDGGDSAQVEHYFNGGLSYLLSNDVQFDLRAGFGMNSTAMDFFVGTGLSIRFQ